MTWEIVVGLIALVGFVISIMTPITKLNTAITKLTCSVDSLNNNMAKNEQRISNHGKEIDKLEHRVTRLEGYHKPYNDGEE